MPSQAPPPDLLNGEEMAGHPIGGPGPRPAGPVCPECRQGRAGQGRGRAELTPTPQSASTPAPATPLHLPLPAAHPRRRLGAQVEKGEHWALRVGLLPPCPTVRESSMSTRGTFLWGPLGFPLGLQLGQPHPVQGLGPRCSRAAPWEPGGSQGPRGADTKPGRRACAVPVLTWALGALSGSGRLIPVQGPGHPAADGAPEAGPVVHRLLLRPGRPQGGRSLQDTELLGGQAAAATSVTSTGVRAGLQRPARPQPGAG